MIATLVHLPGRVDRTARAALRRHRMRRHRMGAAPVSQILHHPTAGVFNSMRSLVTIALLFQALSVAADEPRISLFDMDAIRDTTTLDIRVVKDWHRVKGDFPARQKLITIHVGEFWPGQGYRVPVRMVVPADGKARGFHLTGGNRPEQLRRDLRLRSVDRELLRGGVGLVQTVVQDLRVSGQGVLGKAVHRRFIRTLNPRVTVKYWGWPASLMRCVTAAYAETKHFEPGKVALSGGSKNGASPSIAILHDDRMTALHSSVAPIWDSPLRRCDADAWAELRRYNRRYAEKLSTGGDSEQTRRLREHPFLGGLFGPIYNEEALVAGHSWDDLSKLALAMADRVFITRNLEALEARAVDLYFHPGTHDFVAYDVPWGGRLHPEIPLYLKANSGHGKKRAHPASENDEENKSAFLLQHFFDGTGKMLAPPTVEHEVAGSRLRVTVRFGRDARAESGRIWWIFDRGPDGSAAYIRELIPDDQWTDMKYDEPAGAWMAEIEIEAGASRVDFFSNHRKTLRHGSRNYRTYVSSPYRRVQVRKP